jgi:hypothetical protein
VAKVVVERGGGSLLKSIWHKHCISGVINLNAMKHIVFITCLCNIDCIISVYRWTTYRLMQSQCHSSGGVIRLSDTAYRSASGQLEA